MRRLVTQAHLPPHLRLSDQDTGSQGHRVQTICLLLPPPFPLGQEAILAILRPHITDISFIPTLRLTRIPLHPPTSAEQAAQWSLNYWPCTYNPASQTIQNAPPLHLLRTTQAELNTKDLEQYMRLGKLVGEECHHGPRVGREVGAVIVDPVCSEVIAAAGDARWWTGRKQNVSTEYWAGCDGRPEQHALMRAIAMVAERELGRRRGGEEVETDGQPQDTILPASVGGLPLTQTEKYYFSPSVEESACPDLAGPQEGSRNLPPKQSRPRPETYLCSGLDIYLTHEPCVSCSMAMIHSRFRACVLAKRMPGTGGLCAEKDNGGLGYGMFWRKELNWRVMAFEYYAHLQAEEEGMKGADKQGHLEELFHA